MKTLKSFSKDARSLLIFFESRAVDYGGRVNTAHMNEDDMEIAREWNDSKFIRFGRLCFKDGNTDGYHWCYLSEEAWNLAYQERIARSVRMWEARKFKTTDEKNA